MIVYKPEGEAFSEIKRYKVAETEKLGGNQILMQGGLHPKFKLDWYEELLSDIRTGLLVVQHGDDLGQMPMCAFQARDDLRVC